MNARVIRRARLSRRASVLVKQSWLARSRIIARAICLLALLYPLCAQADGTLEFAVKATYLYKLAAFATWPPGALPANAFTICVVGEDPFGALLDQAVAGQSVQQRAIVVRRYGVITGNPGCQIMYVAGSAAQSVDAVLEILRGAPVLTVTDGQSETDPAGIINFVLEDGYVRFEIDPQLTAQSGLTISSKLLSLAVRLRGGNTR